MIAKIFSNIYNEDFIKIEQSLPYKKWQSILTVIIILLWISNYVADCR
jgi:hypothetical protein